MHYGLPSAKILVLGDSGVGKSSLVHLICHSTVLSSPQWTIGCSLDVKLYENCYLEFWDVGGSINHKIARSFYYSNYHGIMLVYDSTNSKSRTNLNEWLNEATQQSSLIMDLESSINHNIPIITIATKIDLAPTNSYSQLSMSGSLRNSEEKGLKVNSLDVLTFDMTTEYGRENSRRLNAFLNKVIERKLNRIII